MKPPRWPVFLYASVVLLLALASLFFDTFFIVPREQAIYADLHQERLLPEPIPTLFAFATAVPSFFWPAFALLAVLAIAGSLWFLPRGVLAAARIVVIAASVIALAMAIGVAFGLHACETEIHLAQLSRAAAYAQVLEEFGLKEAADGRFDDFQRRFASASPMKIEVLRSADELNPAAQQRRIRQIMVLLNQPSTDAASKKHLLATLWMFRGAINENSKTAQDILFAAKEQAGQEFPDVTSFFVWLESSLGKDDWKPYPLYR